MSLCIKLIILFLTLHWTTDNHVLGVNVTDVEFPICNTDRHCLNLEYEYQCNVSNQEFLVWTIQETRGTFLGQRFFSNETAPVFQTGTIAGGDYFVELLSYKDTLVSNITVTIEQEMNGDTIECAHSVLDVGDIEICTINIPGLPTIDNVTVYSNTFSSSSIIVSWQSSSPCITLYRYSVYNSTNAVTSTVTVTTVLIQWLHPSDSLYCIVVNAIDTGNRIGPDSTLSCWLFDVPPKTEDIFVSITAAGATTSTVNVTWSTARFCVSGESVVLPELVGYEVSLRDIQQLTASITEYTLTTNANTTTITFNEVLNCRTYIVAVIAFNTIGRGQPRTTTIEFPNCSSSNTNSDSVFSSVPISVGITVAITIPATIIITLLLTLLIVCAVYNRKQHSKTTTVQLRRQPSRQHNYVDPESDLTQNAAYANSRVVLSEVYETIDACT